MTAMGMAGADAAVRATMPDLAFYPQAGIPGQDFVRSVRTAAFSDTLRRGLAGPGGRISCSVTPTDGRLYAPPATASAVVVG